MFDTIPVLNEDARALAVAVRDLDIQYRALRGRVVERAGISTAELDALATVANSPCTTPKALAAATHLTTSATTALIDRLEALGFAARCPHPTDRRSVVVTLTEHGEALVTHLYQLYVGKFEALLERFACSGPQLEQTLAALRCFAAAIASPVGEESALAAA